MIAGITMPEQARPTGAHPPSTAIELGADGGTGALPLDRPHARSATGDAMRAELARAMNGREVLR